MANEVLVWKAFRGGETCHFGEHGAANAWAGPSGTVEERRFPVRDLVLAGDQVADLSLLVGRLVRALRKADPSHVLPEKAMDYLRRQGLQGRILRENAAE